MGSADHSATLRDLQGVSRMPDEDQGQQCIPWARLAMGGNVVGRYVGFGAVLGRLMGRANGRQGGDRQKRGDRQLGW